ncbi:SDR family NAD(P)-dependent oxidoreductase [Candidatus Saccharibacteria bacterium]|nr:SDR family NAD(P)-dependent oxidoreductase [Candidatus Saccharibacteria bacterium]
MAKKVVVITGGGSGMGLEAAKFMDKTKIIVLSGRTKTKLEKAIKELGRLGFKAYAKACDTSDRKSVKELVKFASKLGEITNVINAAGVSPAMGGEPEKLMRINALGTVYVDQEFGKVMKKGTAILNVASMSAYQLPKFIIPKKAFPLAETDEALFLKKTLKMAKKMKDSYKSLGLAYGISKNFVVWYTEEMAFRLGKKGIRVVSVSPGLIATGMGKLEEENGGQFIKCSCENRMGEPKELGFAIATIVDERNGYLAGVDVLVDGGTIKGTKRK